MQYVYEYMRAHSRKHIHRVIRNMKVYHNNIMQNNYTIKLLNIIIKLLICTHENNFLNYVIYISIHLRLLSLK